MARERDSLLPKKTKQRGATKLIVATLVGAATLALAAVAVVPRTSKGDHQCLRASPAALKAEALKSGLVQEVDKNRWLPECFAWWQMVGAFPTSENPDAELKNQVEVSDYDLISMPTGLCTNTLFCAFENCAPGWWQVGDQPATEAAVAAMGDFDTKAGDMEQFAKAIDVKFNLPDQIAFPTSVKEVVDVVNYAKKASMPITVKTSGHNYAGSYTLDGSVNVNLRDFPKYSQEYPFKRAVMLEELPALWLCGADWNKYHKFVETPAACKLALARGKPAIIRIGGGELWDDVYRAVDDANQWLEDSGGMVELFGGGAGSVGAAGGWMGGGGLGDGSERVHGVGADNVLELEMVLPSGEHVKFAPSKWEDAPGFLYPKTTEVTGFCNANVVADESEWKWEACEVKVPWEDLWYAVRGGGGGSYGIVTALTYQLHKMRAPLPYELDASSYTDVCPDTKYFTGAYDEAFAEEHKAEIKEVDELVLPAGCKEVQDAFTDFWIDFLWDPAAIGLAEQKSLNCGASNFKFSIADFVDPHCFFMADLPNPDGSYPQGPDVLWEAYWNNYTGPAPEGLDMDKWQKALEYVGGDDFPSNWKTYNVITNPRDFGGQGNNFDPSGRIDSDAALTWGTVASSWSAVIPSAWFLQKNDDVHNLVMEKGTEFHIMGGNVGKLHDQMTSLSDIYRIAGAQSELDGYWFPKVAAFYPEAPEGKILGGAEYNHVKADSFGPLKDDHSAFCPKDLTHAEKEEQCVSLQEHVWGTDGLAKLEAIKAKVDPQGLFQCQKCVGFKGPVRDQ